MNSLETAMPLFDNLIKEEGERLFSYKSLAEYLNVPVKTIQDWVYKRKIPYVRAGRHVRFIGSEIRQWLKKGTSHGHRNSKI